MSKWHRRTAALVAVLALSSCARDLRPLARKTLTTGAEEFARNSIALLSRGDSAAVSEMLASEARTVDAPTGLAALGRELAGSVVDSVALAGFQYSSTLMGSGEWRHWASLTYQVPQLDPTSSGRRYLLATVEEKDSLGKLWVVGIRTNRLEGPLERINAFTLRGKSPAYFLMLAFAVLVPLFILGVEVVCFRSPVRRKWAWMLLILVSGPVTALNWTTGEVHTDEFSVLLLGVGWLRASIYAPVILEVAFPVGAAIFLARRYQLILRARHTTKRGTPSSTCPAESSSTLSSGSRASG